MDKKHVCQLIRACLDNALDVAVGAARTAHEAATHEENVAENKYDTLGLEAAYLAAGQSRRVEELRLAQARWQALVLRDFAPVQGIQVGCLVHLLDADERAQWLFLGPDGAGLKVATEQAEVLVISPRSPLGGALLGRRPGDEVQAGRQTYEILEAC